MKIGIMGGTFDPIHMGHLLAADLAIHEAQLDEIWFMPTSIPPHKDHVPRADDKQRFDMLKLSIQSNPRFVPFDFELKRGGTSYTYDTIQELQALYPEHHFHFVIGGDMVQTLMEWHRIHDLIKMVTFIGLQRAGTPIDWEVLDPDVKESVRMVHMPAIDISSTEIRRRVKSGLPVRYMVHEDVWNYMREHSIYEPRSTHSNRK